MLMALQCITCVHVHIVRECTSHRRQKKGLESISCFFIIYLKSRRQFDGVMKRHSRLYLSLSLSRTHSLKLNSLSYSWTAKKVARRRRERWSEVKAESGWVLSGITSRRGWARAGPAMPALGPGTGPRRRESDY